ncbi:permease [Cytobacillus sp. FJAT-54145]|uniref:Permease n=1 Tax=Cytobacillus spartinae TaxID=3299023 RepID=A0ABW6KD34_9BACI
MTSKRLDFISILLFLLFLALFLFSEALSINSRLSIPKEWLNVNTIFISIVLEAIPFILLGVFVAALIQIFVSEEWLKKFIPKNPVLALFPAVIMGAIFPICECAIVPIVRRLLLKGMPLHVGIVFLVSAPILNPIVFASTYYAFGAKDVSIAYSRMGIAFVVSLIIGAVIYMIFKNKWQLKEKEDSLVVQEHSHSKKKNKVMDTLQHASDEFFDMGKYLIIGAFIASLFQTFLDRSILEAVGMNVWLSPMVMMAFAYVLSLCSEADAFVASSFYNQFTGTSLIAFLVYGPMIDLKNTVVMLAYFNKRFVLIFIGILTVTVYISVMVYHVFF